MLQEGCLLVGDGAVAGRGLRGGRLRRVVRRVAVMKGDFVPGMTLPRPVGPPQFADVVQQQVAQRAGHLGARLRAAIGGYHPGLHGISRSYLEAQQAFETGRKLRPDSVLHGHDEVIPHLVLAQNPVLAERYVNHALGPLMDPKVRNRAQMLETLEAYLARGSVKDAAAALKLHRHTVLYRLDKLRELLGGDLDLPATRLRLQLALDLQKLL